MSFHGYVMLSSHGTFPRTGLASAQPTTANTLPHLASWRGAIDWDNNIWVYRELYAKHLTAEQLADKILECEELDPEPHYTVLDASCWNKTGMGPSIAETMMRAGVRWIPSDRNRLQEKNGSTQAAC